MSDLVFLAQELLKILPGLILLPFSIYFAWRKIGQKLSISYATFHSRTSAPRIGNINITNLKDKPLTIFSMHAVIDKDIAIEIEKFSPPLLLKPLESTAIETNPYSFAYIGKDQFEPDFSPRKSIEIFAISNHGEIKCKIETPPEILSLKSRVKYRIAAKSTQRFNGKVYNERAKYAITYILDSKQQTAIIDDSGFIGEDWDFKYNMIPSTHMTSKEKVTEYLNACGFDKFLMRFFVDELPVNHSTERA